MRIAKPIQGIIIILLVAVLGSGLFFFVRQDDEEGFLGLATFKVSTIPQITPEPTEELDFPEPVVTIEPALITPEPDEAAPPTTEPSDEAPPATTEPNDEVAPATTEPNDEAPPATSEPTDGNTSALNDGQFSALQAASDGSSTIPQEDGTAPTAITQSFPAPLGADVNILFQWFAFLGLLVGASFAVRKDFTTHRNIMTFWVLMNWFSITGRMTRTVEGYLEAKGPTYSQEVIYLHATLGLAISLYATYLVVRMWFENQLPGWFKVKNIKLWMRVTITGWLFLIALGTYMYFDIYSN